MKVILLAPTPPPNGGIASWTVRMLSCRLKNGWKVDVVDEKLIGGREIFGDRVKLNYYTELRRTLGIWKNLIIKLKDSDVEVVHSNIPAVIKGMLRELGCLIIAKLHRKKFIIHFRCTIPNLINDRPALMVFQILTRYSNAIIALNTLSNKFSEKHSKTPVYLIPNFIERTAIRENKQFTVNKEVRRAVYVGGVIAEKGCLDIIEASRHFPDIEFRLIGRAAKEVETAVKTNNVIIMGEQVKEIVCMELEAADLFLFPSYFSGEGFSNALVEAMAKGLPCIASDWAANVDMLENKGGIIVPVRDSEALAAAIEKIRDQELRQSMSVWNIRKVAKCYNEDIITSQYVDLYEEVCRKG